MFKRAIYGIMPLIIAVMLIGVFAACEGPTGTGHTHTWEWIETTPATLEAGGVETETCKICGATRGTKPIPKLTLTCECEGDAENCACEDC